MYFGPQLNTKLLSFWLGEIDKRWIFYYWRQRSVYQHSQEDSRPDIL